MPKRQYFELPSGDAIERMTDNDYRRVRRGMIKRTKEIFRLFGPPRSMLFMGVMTSETYFEMTNAYICGLYLSTIFNAHAFIESALAFGYILNAEDGIAEGGLGKIVLAAFESGHISKEIFARLNELRTMRTAYFHSHAGLHKRGAMKRYLDNKTFGVEMHQKDAKDALKIVHEFLRSRRPAAFAAIA
jgi:hypothetical protein